MKGLFSNRWVILGLRLILGGVFVYSGVIKAISPQGFADNVSAFQLLPAAFVNLFALSLPVFEVLAGLMLIAGVQMRVATLSVLVLSVVFAGALGSALARGLKIDCGCFGSGAPSTLKTWMALGRDILLGLAALMIRRISLGPPVEANTAVK